ncbi:uncharacterized protein LOC129806742 [Phlebotomus papatasi]|uniref:uncharacterized protein LOC129806742 n=1 Tax=Phlebotomus papatasi TaxID=29031 RepID=UPI0024842DB0|nr:uncharacterized protein LOC129806742 [Phlebotomus papatasi]
MSEDKQEEKNNAWNMLARELNAMEKYKPPKTSQEWIKTWKGMQSHAKKAATKIKKDVDETGGGPGSGAQLTSRQERIIALIAPRVRGILQKGANCSTVLGAVHDHKYANLSKMIHDRIADAQIESDSSNFSYNSSDEENSISDNSVPNEIPANQSLNTAFPAFPKTAKINRVENKASGPSYANPTPGPSFANTAADHYANPTPGPSFANTAADHYANPTPGPSFANTAADHYANPTPGPSFANTAADHYANPTPGPSFANTAADHYVNPTPGSSSCKTATKPSCVAPIPGSSNVKTISSRTLSCSGSYNGQKSVIKRNQQYGKTRSPFGNTSSRVTKMTTNNNEPRISFAFSGGNDKRSDPCTASKVTSPTKEV